MTNQLTIQGNLTDNPTRRTTNNGEPWITFTIATTPRRKNQTGDWEDAGPTLFLDCKWFGQATIPAAHTMAKGQPVLATGHLRATEWLKDGETRRGIELNVARLGIIPKQQTQQAPQPAQQPPQQATQPVAQPMAQPVQQQPLTNDPWANTNQPENPPF